MKKHQKTNIVLTILLIAILLFYPAVKNLSEFELLKNFLSGFGILSPFVFGIIVVILSLFFFPVSLLAVFSGMLFGKINGFLIILFFSTAAGMLGFLFAHRLSSLIPKAQKGLVKRIQRNAEIRMKKNTFSTVALLRLLYLNFMGVTYAVGLVKSSRFWSFTAATFLANVPYLFAFAFFGNELMASPETAVIPAAVILLIMTASLLIGKSNLFKSGIV